MNNDLVGVCSSETGIQGKTSRTVLGWSYSEHECTFTDGYLLPSTLFSDA